MSVTFTDIKPEIGSLVHVDKAHLLDDEVIEQVRQALETRGVLVFPQIDVSDEEQLAFTDRLGTRTNFTKKAPGSDVSAADVYKITLDKKINTEPDYVLGTFFWHIDGLLMDIPLPKATVLSARRLSDEGGSTEFANLYAAYEHLSDQEKRELEGLRVIHTIEAYILNPLIYGAHLRMNPVLVLAILVISHHLFGIWGLVLGVPVMNYVAHYVISSVGRPREP